MGKSPSGWRRSSTLVGMRSATSAPLATRIADTRQRLAVLVVGVVAASAGGLVLASAEGTLVDLPGGVRGLRVSDAGALADAIARAMAEPGPTLIEAVM